MKDLPPRCLRPHIKNLGDTKCPHGVTHGGHNMCGECFGDLVRKEPPP